MRNCVVHTLRRISLGYRIKKDERNTACSMHVTEAKAERVLVINPEDCRPVRRRRRKWEDIIKMRVRIYDLKAWINPLNAELNPICHLLALLGAHHIFHFSGLRVKLVWLSTRIIRVVLWKQQRTYRFCKIKGIYWLNKRLLDSRERLRRMEWMT